LLKSLFGNRSIVMAAFALLTFHVLAVFALLHFTLEGLLGFALLHFATGCLGLSLGYHRYLSHGSFRCHGVFKFLLIFSGVLAFQKGPITWAAMHKAHHKHTDRFKDPHSRARGFFWAHLGWTLTSEPNGFRTSHFRNETSSLWQDPVVMFLEKNFYLVNFGILFLAFFALPFSTWLWVFPLRIVVVWHSTWVINSYLHFQKSKGVFEIRDSRWVSVITYGEGFHATHHQRPAAAFYFPSWSPWDFSGGVLRVAARMGLADKVKKLPLPSEGGRLVAN
jgi:fatty-acid desaturase